MAWKIRIPLSKTIDGEIVLRHYYEIDIYTDSFSRANHCETYNKEFATVQEAINKVAEMIENDKDCKELDGGISWKYTITLCEETAETTWTTTYKVYKYKGEVRIKELEN